MPDATRARPLVWLIDSSRSSLAGSLGVFEPWADARYFAADEPLPSGGERPAAAVFSAEIEGGPNGEAFQRLASDLAQTPLLAAAGVRSLAQAVAYFRAGAVDYLSLPLDPAEVGERLAAALAAPSAVLELQALDGEGADVVLTLGGIDDGEEALSGDILAHLDGRGDGMESLPRPGAAESGPPTDGEEPVAVDGLPIPSLWEELPCGLLAFDSAGNLVFSNSLGLGMFGFAALAELQDALDNRRASFMAIGANGNPLPDNQWPHHAASKAKVPRHAVVSIERPDKSRAWLRMDCLPHLADGEISRISMTLVNMTGELPPPAVGDRKHGRGRKHGARVK